MSDKKEEGAKRTLRTADQWFDDGAEEVTEGLKKRQKSLADAEDYDKAGEIKEVRLYLEEKIKKARNIAFGSDSIDGLYDEEGPTNEN